MFVIRNTLLGKKMKNIIYKKLYLDKSVEAEKDGYINVFWSYKRLDFL